MSSPQSSLNTERLVTTYLEMRSPTELRISGRGVRKTQLSIRELREPNWKFNRDMYFQVGEKWKWIDKRPWTEAQWKEYASNPRLRTFAGYYGDEVAGYFELLRASNRGHDSSAFVPRPRDYGAIRPADAGEQVEIAYFGLLPEFIGRGLGGELLTNAIETGWAWTPTPLRIWVHTCNRDHSSALTNYQARGFKIYKVTSDQW